MVRRVFDRRPVIAGALLVAVGALLAAGVIGGRASGQSAPTGTLTFKEIEKGASFTHIRNTTEKFPKANLQGDVIAALIPVGDTSGNRIGKVHLACATTSGARNHLKAEAVCTAIVALRDGTLATQFLNGEDATTVGAITGGTGAYANATGTFVSKSTKSGTVDTITFGG